MPGETLAPRPYRWPQTDFSFLHLPVKAQKPGQSSHHHGYLPGDLAAPHTEIDRNCVPDDGFTSRRSIVPKGKPRPRFFRRTSPPDFESFNLKRSPTPMKILRRFAFMHVLIALFVTSAALSAFADPPSRAVRLQYISGPVSIQPGGVNDWVEAVVN